MAKTITSKIEDIPKPEWECFTCGSKIYDCIFDKQIWKWKITKTYHFTGFWLQNRGNGSKNWVYVGDLCTDALDMYCRECGAVHPRHYPMCSRLSGETRQRYEEIRRRSKESQKRYEFKGTKDLAESKRL